MDHGGHRERLKERYLSEGLLSLGEERTLEMLLFYCIPRKDTYLLAKELINRFGSLWKVLEASREALERVDGVGPGAATYLKFLGDIYGQHSASSKREGIILDSVEKCGDYMRPYFSALQHESVCVLCMDAQYHPKDCEVVMRGDINTVNVPIRKIVEFASSCKAGKVVLGHNHPSGVAIPSQEDIVGTRMLVGALHSVDIELVDHLIFSDDDFLSMQQSNLISTKGFTKT